MPIKFRFKLYAAIPVDPTPMNGSKIVSLSLDAILIIYSIECANGADGSTLLASQINSPLNL